MSTAIVVLGGPNEPDGTLSVIAKSRSDAAFAQYCKYQNARILCMGGFGSFNISPYPHAELSKRYLISLGVPANCFLDNALSRFTFEDATLSKPILVAADIDKVILVSSDFHLNRVQYVFRHVIPHMSLDCVPAVTPLSNETLAKLHAHEKMAMRREEENIRQLKCRDI